MKTKTYAEILASQGEFSKAAEIYRHLAVARPTDASLKARMAELEGLAATADAEILAAFHAETSGAPLVRSEGQGGAVGSHAPRGGGVVAVTTRARGRSRNPRRQALEALLARIVSRRRA